MTYQIDISREAVDGVAAFWWGKGYPKIGNLLWSLSAALDAADVTISDLTAQLSDAHKLIDDNWVTHQRVVTAEADKARAVEALTFLHKAMTDNHKVSPPPHRLQIHDGSWHEGPVVDFVHDLLSVMRDYIAAAIRTGAKP